MSFAVAIAAIASACASSVVSTAQRQMADKSATADIVCDAYWHWMNGNITKDGITADLEHMRAAGLDAAMIFDVGVGVKRGPVDYGSEEWMSAIAWASSEAKRLGMTLSIHNSPGYSACGGPWIRPEESMKQLVWDSGRFPDPSRFAKMGYYREIARYPLSSMDEMYIIGKRIEKGETLEVELGEEREIAAINIWRGEREKPLDPHDGPRDYGCTLKIEGVGEVRCPTLRARDVPGRLELASPVKASKLVIKSSRGANIDRIEVISSSPAAGRSLVIGYTTTGQMLAAAPDAGVGLECDKFSRIGVDAQFERSLDPLFAKIGKGAFEYITIDSWEAGGQDWTDDFAAAFASSRGYDPIPWLPSLTTRHVLRGGRILSVAPAKEPRQWEVKFKDDYERMKRELFETQFLAPLKEHVAALGLKLAGEPYGDGDFDMETYVKYLDLPMSEYWTRTHYGSIERPLMVVAAAKNAGRKNVGCEAFTAYPGDADAKPDIETFGDAIDILKMAGINRFVLHCIAHQPDDEPMTMGPFGARFDRHHCTVEELNALVERIKE